MKGGDGNLYRGGWVQTDGPPYPGEHAWSSSRYEPDEDAAVIDIGEQRTEEAIKPAITKIPDRVCRSCWVGDPDWIETGTWPPDAPPVVLGADGWPVDCTGGDCAMCVRSVGLQTDPEFDVSGSPITGAGVLRAFWHPVPAGYVLAGPTSGPDAKPTFKPPTSLPQTTIYNAVIAIVDGTPLSGLAPIGGYTPTAGDRVLTWDQVDHVTSGIWIASASAWTRAADFDAGLTLNGPAYVWCRETGDDFPGAGSLFTVVPDCGPGIGNPPAWVVGTDAALIAFATLPAVIAGTAPISVSYAVSPVGTLIYGISLSGSIPPGDLPTLDSQASSNGPLSGGNLSGLVPSTNLPSLDTQAGVNGPLSAPNLGSGTLGGGVLLPAPQLSAGSLGSGVLLPAAQLSAGTIPPGVDIPASQVTGGGTGSGFTFVATFVATGSGQSTAALLTTMTVTRVTSFTGGANVILPTSPGICLILNQSGTGITVWCPIGGTMSGTTNGSTSLPGLTNRMWFSADGTNWGPEF